MIEQAYRLAGRLCEPWLARPEAPRGPPGLPLLIAASAGETKAARAFVAALPGPALVGTGTDAGLRAGADLRLPRDLPGRTAALFDALRPSALVLVEAELWPNLLAEATARGIPIGCVGARMSPRSAARWGRAPRSARALLTRVRAFAAASQEDADRLAGLGATPGSLRVCGPLKWPDPPGEAAVEALRAELEDRGEPLLVLGSVHPGELRAAARALSGSALAPDRTRWMVVPRHGRALPALRREARGLGGRAPLFETRFGVLRAWYGASDAALVGGGARGRGTHDLLEPLALGRRPLFFGARGDPGGLGELLCARGLATRLDGPVAPILEGPMRCPGAYAELRSELDGRAAARTFLQERGVLP